MERFTTPHVVARAVGTREPNPVVRFGQKSETKGFGPTRFEGTIRFVQKPGVGTQGPEATRQQRQWEMHAYSI